jgi:MFS family permease
MVGVSGKFGRRAGRAAAGAGRLARRGARGVEGQMVSAVGGPARARVIFIFGAVLGLSSADAATVGAAATQLESSLHIGNAEVGLLNTVALLAGGLGAIPVGLMVDRVNRVRLLSIAVVLWSAATRARGAAAGYPSLLLTRVALGAVSATAGPAIASLTGDYFAARERGRVYGYILGGETAGIAVGFLISGSVAGLLSWRFAFWVLSIPGFLLAWTMWRTLPEPLRNGQSRLRRGAEDLFAAARGEAPPPADEEAPAEGEEDELAREAVRRRNIAPEPSRILREDPGRMRLMRAVRYVLAVPTNLAMIIASALGYFFLAGLQTFAVVFVRGHFGTGQFSATGILGLLIVGALVGTLVSGRVTDWMLRRGWLTARMLVPGICFLGAVALLIPGLTSRSLTPAIFFDMGAAALISAVNPPVDAARLDIMPAGLWGRAESIRTLLRTLGQAIAPLLFGAIADLVAGFSAQNAPIGTESGGVSAATARGLEVSFLVMLVPLAAAGIIMLRARHHYPRDVATAAASAEQEEAAAAA